MQGLLTQQFPNELVSKIARDCSTTDLVNLSLVNKAYRIEAERYLYRSISLFPWRPEGTDRTNNCLQLLLSSTADKARLVRSFELRMSSSTEKPKRVFRLMCKVLLKLENLKQLALYTKQPGCTRSHLLATLRECTFSLDSFCSDRILRLDSWAFEHKSLRLFALDGQLAESTGRLQRMHTLVQKQRESSPLFEMCSFYRDGAMYTNNIELFPIFNPVDETGTPQWTARAAKEISDRFSYTMGINSINVYLTSMSHIPTLKSVLRSIATNFQVYELCICVEETHINTDNEAFAEILGQMSHLYEVNVAFWNRDIYLPNTYVNSVKDIATEWTINSPNIIRLGLPHGAWVERENGGEWGVMQ